MAAPDEERMIPTLEATVPEDRLEDVFGVVEAMGSYHPVDPCWCLPLIAVDPYYQGQGIGLQLIKHALAIVDRDGLPAYLSRRIHVIFHSMNGMVSKLWVRFK